MDKDEHALDLTNGMISRRNAKNHDFVQLVFQHIIRTYYFSFEQNSIFNILYRIRTLTHSLLPGIHLWTEI